LKENGIPHHPSDLANHNIIQSSPVEPTTTWQFESAASKTSVNVTPRLLCSQNGIAISAARQGLGITRVMSYQIGEEVKNGTLVPILREHESNTLPVNIIHLEGRKANAKIRAFVDLAIDRLKANPYIDHS
jgi:DNA-binding transcriptional LysR family regulator